ncbi:MAG: DNA polymerase III PolC-type [Chlamydiae bacterium]|nr:DNA polymerase III PolC-type [Chlamydiota bacterium]
MSPLHKRPIYYDTETTGLHSKSDHIIELAAYDPVNNRSFSKLINPGVPIPAAASAIHKITDQMVADAASFAEVGREFIDFCDGEIVLIAHNNDGFDRHFLVAEGERAGITWPAWPMVDSLKWARKYRPDLPRHSLQFLRKIYGVAENNAHRALDDVVVLHQVFSAMIDDLSMEKVLELLDAPNRPLSVS